jgi:hypothetical protein
VSAGFVHKSSVSAQKGPELVAMNKKPHPWNNKEDKKLSSL